MTALEQHEASGEAAPAAGPRKMASIDCGWGRLLFAQTVPDADSLAEALRSEGTDRRDIALYVQEPHVVLAAAPQELFLDPSHTSGSISRATGRRSVSRGGSSSGG
jgi:hypothetical protein